jgi:hypothetical protein
VLLSEAESHPVAVMEALLLERPVLVADTSGLSELAQRGLARAVPLDCPPAETAQAMLEQLHQPRAPGPMRLPTWDDCAQSLLDLYRSVVAGTGRPAGAASAAWR